MDDLGINVFLMIITTFILYVIGIIRMIQSYIKYKYHIGWLIISFGLFPLPIFIFLLYPYCEKKAVERKAKDSVLTKVKKVKYRIAGVFVLGYILAYYAINLYLRFGVDAKWHGEITYNSLNIAAIVLFIIYICMMPNMEKLFVDPENNKE